MGEILRHWLKQSAPMDPGLDAMLNLLVAAKLVENDFEAMLSPFGITRRQYNVLRILKGAFPGGHPRSEIVSRVLEQSPDITRIIDRLGDQRLITRSKGKTDKRESLTMITPKGIQLVDKIGPPVANFMKDFEKKISVEGCRKLSELCEELYGEKVTQL